MFDPPVVNVGIEIFSYSLTENLPQVGAVVAKEGRYGFQLDIVLKVMVDIEENVVQDRIPRRITVAFSIKGIPAEA